MNNTFKNNWQKLEETQKNEGLGEIRQEEDAVYAAEWKTFWQRRYLELKSEGKNPADHNYEPEWMVYWHTRKKELDQEKMEEKKLELKRQYGLLDHCGSSQSKDPVQSTFYPKMQTEDYSPHPSLQPIGILSSKELDNQKLSSVSSTSTPSRVMLSCDLLQVLRQLTALEDCLGSIGPSITLLLSRSLSTERYEAGSSAKLLEDDPSCVDLLDTSKEKLKGLLSASILDGAKATAATVAVENVAALLLHFHHPKRLPISTPSLPSVDMATLMANLQAAGLLLRSQPTVLSHPVVESTFHTCSGTSYHSSTDSVISCNSQESLSSNRLEPFSVEEIKILIFHFRTLTSSQQRDLIDYLRHLENSNIDGMTQSVPPSTTSSSPLSKKYRQFESAINPTAPDLPKIRCPTILKMTGLSFEDLELFGIPVDKVEAHYNHNVSFCESINPTPEDYFPWVPPRKISNPRSSPNSNHLPHTIGCQQQSWPPKHVPIVYPSDGMNCGSVCPFPVTKCNNEQDLRQSNLKSDSINQDDVSKQNESQRWNRDELRRLSFCNEHLDPRRSRVDRQRKCASKFRNVFFDIQLRLKKAQEPIIIPTSPIYL